MPQFIETMLYWIAEFLYWAGKQYCRLRHKRHHVKIVSVTICKTCHRIIN